MRRLWFAFGIFAGCQCAQLPDLMVLCDDANCLDGGNDMDSGFDAGIDAGSDGGSDAGFDAGVDAGCQALACPIDAGCGTFSDGCGNLMTCDFCIGRDTCGGGGVANQCGCTPKNLFQLCVGGGDASTDGGGDAGIFCGNVYADNGCGVFVDAGCGSTCPGGSTCVDNRCCIPQPDSEFCTVFQCGLIERINRCGERRLINCGSCAMNFMCVQMEEPMRSMCGACLPEDDFTFCDRHGANCEVLDAGDNCGNPRAVDCGSCDDGGCGLNQPNLCGCREPNAGCTDSTQCCSGTICGRGALQKCCVDVGGSCTDDLFCCHGSCGYFTPAGVLRDGGGECCNDFGQGCLNDGECCSGNCVSNVCALFDAGVHDAGSSQ
jgi:hypothetical protein